jgi:LPS O-antigen subunit length determinant protein (WzzB/FepE family)
MNEINEMNQVQNDEIDLFELFETLWAGKWKIIATTFVAAVIGVVFSVVKPNSYKVSTPIQSGKQSVFLQYVSLNDLLKNEGMLYEKETNPNGYIVNGVSIFKMFVFEFNDYEEMVDAVSTSEFVQKSIKDLDGDDKQRALIDFAKSFELKAPSTNEENWTLSFVWHDDLEGVRLFENAIRQTLSNIKNVSIANVNELGEAIDIRNSNQIEMLRQRLKVIELKQITSNLKRIQFLKEHSAIAKELGVERNTLDTNLLAQSQNNLLFQSQNESVLSESGKNKVLISPNFDDVPYYLRGYKAIDKEIALINSRSKEQNLLRAVENIEIEEKIALLETDISSSQLRNAMKMLQSDNPNDFIEFDLALADVKSQKRLMPYAALSIVLGGLVGALYVLISNAIRKRKEQLAKA